ncbi:MAG TPA: AAA family ATPase [Vicinamibacterales bacterium]|nr:AAA family ATPase [Vicinamibacterales bacterium]
MWAEPRDVDKSLRVLIVGSDRGLEEEFRGALSRVPDRQGTIYFVDSHREAVETARRRQPNLILVEIDRPAGEIAALAKELQAEAPDAAIAGAFVPDRLEQGQSEGATIIELLRAQVRDFVRRPLSTTELRAVLDRLFSRQAGSAGPVAQGRVAAFVSNKGGVGKSTLAVNVACGLALRHPDDVLLVDTSLQVGSCAMLLDLRPTTSIVDAIRERDRLDRTLLRHLTLRHGSGLRLLAAPVDALEGVEVDDEAISRVLNMARRSFKYVIVDTFPMLDSVLMTTLDAADVAFIVVQGLAPAVAGVARLLPVLEGLGLPAARQRLVLNYNYKPFLGNLQPSDIANRLQRTLDFVVPYEGRVLPSMNTGSPHILHTRRWERFGRTINHLVDDLDAWNGDASTSLGTGARDAEAQMPHARRVKTDQKELL